MEMETKRFLLHLLLGTAAIILIFLTSVQVPLLGVVLSIFMPLPIMLLSHFWGLVGGGLAVLIGTVVISTVLTPLLGLIFLVEFGVLGILLYHYVVRRGFAWDHGILFSSLIVLGMLTLLVLTARMATSFDIVNWIRQEIHETSQVLLQPYGGKDSSVEAFRLASEKLTGFVLRIFPALILLTIWFEGIVNVTLFTRITSRSVPASRQIVMRPEFSIWICPDRLVWGGIIGGFLIITRITPLVTIGINIVIVLAAVYFLQGIAIVSFLFKKKNVPFGLRVMGYALIGIIQILPILVAALGLFDIWIDFRKLRPRVTAHKRGL